MGKKKETESKTKEAVENMAKNSGETQEQPIAEPQEGQEAKKDGTVAVQAALDECKDKLLRNMAEFDNFRKRTAKEKETMFQNGVADAVSAFLPVLDNLYRAQKSLSEQSAASGIEMIIKQFLDIMGSLGVSEIEAEGKPFDPNLHNAVMHIEDEAYNNNTVAEVFTKGYILGDRVIRHCMVKVAN